jgi:hypothetical protein
VSQGIIGESKDHQESQDDEKRGNSHRPYLLLFAGFQYDGFSRGSFHRSMITGRAEENHYEIEAFLEWINHPPFCYPLVFPLALSCSPASLALSPPTQSHHE